MKKSKKKMTNRLVLKGKDFTRLTTRKISYTWKNIYAKICMFMAHSRN